MRRTLAVVVMTLALPVSVLAAAPAPAEETLPGQERVATTMAQRSLDRAADVLDGGPAATSTSATLALRDLFTSLPALEPADRSRAGRLLARPTDRGRDSHGDGYTTSSRRKCSGALCLHWVTSTEDAPPDRAWVDKTLSVLERVWRKEVDTLGYRRPPRDGERGGSGKYDVYLKDVGAQGLYGYCSTERRKRGRTATSYIVLDNDFSRDEFFTRPIKSLKATAAHEFFHAIQFAHDYDDDGWFMESTATWMEERVFDGVNDNRQYLDAGQVGAPGSALDTYDNAGVQQYGNWAFFEHLTQRFGNRIVRRAWRNAAHHRGAPKLYSTKAIVRALPRGQRWTSVFRRYSASNAHPAQTYAEGAAWPEAPVRARRTLTSASPASDETFTLAHLAAQHVAVTPGEGVTGEKWRLRVSIDGPRRRTSPAAYLWVRRTDGSLRREAVRLNRRGVGTERVRFGSSQVRGVTLTLVNGSTRFYCDRGTQASCHGASRDDRLPFSYRIRAVRS